MKKILILFLLLLLQGCLKNNNHEYFNLAETDTTINYKYFTDNYTYNSYTLENDYIKCVFSEGILYSVENKISGNKNFLNPGDSMINGNILFALYKQKYTVNNKIEVLQNKNSILFKCDNQEMKYTINKNKIYYNFITKNKNNLHSFRINFIGNKKIKAITSWEVKNISRVINEKDFDNTDVDFIELEYKIEDNINYYHKDVVFNEWSPYHLTRKFIKLNNNSEFTLYNNDKVIFKIYNSSTRYFFYKNCSGEECFHFGLKHPYQTGQRQIKNNFKITLEVL